MKKKKFPVFILCSLLTLTNIQTPWAFSDEAPDDPEIPFRSLLTVDLQTLFSKNGFPKTLIQIATGFSLTRKSPCAQKSVFLPCQSIPWKASNIFII